MAKGAPKGVTLGSILAVVLIVGAEAVVAIPRINAYIKQHELNNAAREVWQDMHRARMMAIKEKRSVRVEFDYDSYTVIRVATGEVAFKRFLAVKYPDIIIGTTDERGRLVFDRMGATEGGTTEIEIQGPAGTRRFTILATGKIGGLSS